MTACLLCHEPHTVVPCVEPWAIVHLSRPVENVRVKGNLL